MAQSEKYEKISIKNVTGITPQPHKAFSEHIMIEFCLKKKPKLFGIIGREGSRDPGLGERSPCKGHDA